MSAEKATQSWNSLKDAAETDDVEVEEVWRKDLFSVDYRHLMNAARSAEDEDGERLVDLSDSPKKDELVDRMIEANIIRGPVGDNDFYVVSDEDPENARHIELKESQYNPNGSNGDTGPTDKTVLYCLTRKETTEGRVEAIADALDDVGFDLRPAGKNDDKLAIVLPAENDPEQAHYFESDEEEEEEEEQVEEEEEPESDSEEPEEAESEEEEQEDEEEGGEEESESEESEGSEEDEEPEEDEEDDETVPEDIVRERWDEKAKSDLYDMAKEYDVKGRSDMTKDELIDALVEVHPKVDN
jgi:hypothetical protein